MYVFTTCRERGKSEIFFISNFSIVFPSSPMKRRNATEAMRAGLVSSHFQLCLSDRLNPNFRLGRKAIRLDGLVWSAEVFHCVAVMTQSACSSLWQMRGETFSLNSKFTVIGQSIFIVDRLRIFIEKCAKF